MSLTDTAIKALKPKDKPYKIADGGGMYLEVATNGSKYWRYRYRWLGKQKLLALGVYPDVSLKDARDKRDAARKDLAAGYDPSATRKQNREFQLKESENTFEKLAREWHQKNLARWSEKHGMDVLYRLEKDIFPALGHMPVRSISASTMLSAIRKIEARGAHELARRARGTCEQIFAYGIGTDRADKNVALNLRGTLTAFKRGHFNAITGSEISDFVRRLKQNSPRLYPQTIRATMLLMLTFVRTSELINAKWHEFDFDKRVSHHNKVIIISSAAPLRSEEFGAYGQSDASQCPYRQFLRCRQAGGAHLDHCLQAQGLLSHLPQHSRLFSFLCPANS